MFKKPRLLRPHGLSTDTDGSFIMETMINAPGTKIQAQRLSAYALALPLALVVLTSIASGQQKRPDQSPANVQFVNGHQALNIPFEFEYNQIVLKVRVNDSTPLKFMFDTGAGASVLSAGGAAGLHLKRVDTVNATGVGGQVTGYLVTGISLSVAGARVLNQRLAVLPLDSLPCEMKDIGGIIGYDFIKEFVVEINYEARTISLFEPLSYQYNGRGDVVPIILTNTPRVRARVGMPGGTSLEGLFEIDTGSDGALWINSPFVKKHGLIQSLKTQLQSSNTGIGGETESVEVRLSSLGLGRFVISNPLVSLSQDTAGSLALEDNDGPLGNEILQRFKVILDYSRRRMVLEQNAQLSDPFEDDMSGIILNSEGKDCRV
jgi:Aspartyl protease